MTHRFIVVADSRKNSVVLGTSVSFEAPIPTKTFAYAFPSILLVCLLKFHRLRIRPSCGVYTQSLVHRKLPCAWHAQKQVQWLLTTATSSSMRRLTKLL